MVISKYLFGAVVPNRGRLPEDIGPVVGVEPQGIEDGVGVLPTVEVVL